MKINNKQKIRIAVVTIFSVSFITSAFKLSNINVEPKEENKEIIAYGQTHLSKVLYDNMLDRKESLKIYYVNDDYKEVFEDIKDEKTIEYIASIDDINTSDDYDYLLYNLKGIETDVINNGPLNTTFDMAFNWRESKEEAGKVNKEVKRIIKELNIEEKSDYEKIKIIHDKIAENVRYDKSLDYQTAYNALFNGTATCQGYSMLFYKFMTELNIPCKYITGIGINEDSGEHGWNIVKLGDKWYNIDVTWDDPIHYNADGSSSEENKIIYDNFLKGSKEFNIKHKKDKKI